MLVCYLDDSGNKTDPIITIAGYLSLADEWKLFEQKARAYLSDKNVSHLHTVDFHHAKREFEDWSWERRTDFICGLYDILAPHCGLSVEFTVLKSVYVARHTEHGRPLVNSSFGFCFLGIIDRLAKDEGVSVLLAQSDMSLSFVVESGHRNNGDIERIFKRHKADPKGQIFNTLEFADKKSNIALQMADFVAYYSRRFRVGSGARRKAELDWFKSVTRQIRSLPFYATDFGW